MAYFCNKKKPHKSFSGYPIVLRLGREFPPGAGTAEEIWQLGEPVGVPWGVPGSQEPSLKTPAICLSPYFKKQSGWFVVFVRNLQLALQL